MGWRALQDVAEWVGPFKGYGPPEDEYVTELGRQGSALFDKVRKELQDRGIL
jgi:hypothetical protein